MRKQEEFSKDLFIVPLHIVNLLIRRTPIMMQTLRIEKFILSINLHSSDARNSNSLSFSQVKEKTKHFYDRLSEF